MIRRDSTLKNAKKTVQFFRTTSLCCQQNDLFIRPYVGETVNRHKTYGTRRIKWLSNAYEKKN